MSLTGRIFMVVTGLNPNFACRAGDPSRQQPGFVCNTGDDWRQANILADAVTLLSSNFKPATATYPKFGYRNEGDFDLRNNAGNTVVGYDLPEVPNTLSEVALKIDLNGNGKLDPVSVPKAEITAKGARMLNGFQPYNNFVTNGLSSGRNTNRLAGKIASFDINRDGQLLDANDNVTTQTDANYIVNTGTTPLSSTYFNNFVTPIQRRGSFSEYVMEICRKLPVSSCGPDDWVVGSVAEEQLKAEMVDPDTLPKIVTDAALVASLLSGTTVLPPLDRNDQRYPRRIAFLRNNSGVLELVNNKPVPLGINSAGKVQCYTYDTDFKTCKKFSTEKPRTQSNALFFRTIKTAKIGTPNSPTIGDWGYSANEPLWYYNETYNTPDRIDHPRLVPILQIQAPTQTSGLPANASAAGNANATRWFPQATDTIYNLVVAAGDVPSRPGNASNVGGETNGGLQNIVRVIENWGTPTPAKNITISGSFVQLGRSAYATAPYQSIRSNTPPANIFLSNMNVYANSSGSGRIAYFIAPGRNWGYDVGLLSQVYPETRSIY
ncbi:MAG: hypothetical protein RSE13_09875 [Planktothrix sp. GU0601_MAG3]|nr:MAG: hypothetical protein RSE13_09875 [Planktothrix sp. GU0601_MAG3]